MKTKFLAAFYMEENDSNEVEKVLEPQQIGVDVKRYSPLQPQKRTEKLVMWWSRKMHSPEIK